MDLQSNLDEFLRTGVDQIDEMFAWLDELGVQYRTGRALDFGCGIGRLTQALARKFTRCDGVDIAPTMIDRAHEINQFGDRVRYHVNDRDGLALFDDDVFDLAYSDIVLQYIEPEDGARYVHEFTRVLAPGGVAVFQLPSHPLDPDDREIPRPRPGADDQPDTAEMEIHGIRRANVEAILLAGTVDLVVVKESNRANGWCDYWYVGVKREPPPNPRRRLRDRLRRN